MRAVARAGPPWRLTRDERRTSVLSVARCGMALMVLDCAPTLHASAAAAPARGAIAKDGTKHAACVAGFRAILVGSERSSRAGSETLAALRAEDSALLDVCGPDEMALATEAEDDARWFAACREAVTSEASCERLLRERRLYRTTNEPR